MNTNNTTYGFDNCNSPFNKHKPTCIEKITQIEKALQEVTVLMRLLLKKKHYHHYHQQQQQQRMQLLLMLQI